MSDLSMQTQGLEAVSALSDDERQACEVWTRVMGYHRPLASFNIGKKGEHCERQFFREPQVNTAPAVSAE
jgi:anaerobic ribonucleoside-triphosphate reductase